MKTTVCFVRQKPGQERMKFAAVFWIWNGLIEHDGNPVSAEQQSRREMANA